MKSPKTLNLLFAITSFPNKYKGREILPPKFKSIEASGSFSPLSHQRNPILPRCPQSGCARYDIMKGLRLGMVPTTAASHKIPIGRKRTAHKSPLTLLLKLGSQMHPAHSVSFCPGMFAGSGKACVKELAAQTLR